MGSHSVLLSHFLRLCDNSVGHPNRNGKFKHFVSKLPESCRVSSKSLNLEKAILRRPELEPFRVIIPMAHSISHDHQGKFLTSYLNDIIEDRSSLRWRRTHVSSCSKDYSNLLMIARQIRNRVTYSCLYCNGRLNECLIVNLSLLHNGVASVKTCFNCAKAAD